MMRDVDSIFKPRSRRNLVLTASLVVALTGVAPQALAAEGDVVPDGGPMSDAPSNVANVPAQDGGGNTDGDAKSDDDGNTGGDNQSNDGQTAGDQGGEEVKDTRTDLEKAADDLTEKTEARDAAKGVHDAAKNELDELNAEIESAVTDIHDEKQDELDEAEEALDEAKAASDAAKVTHDETTTEAKDAQADLDEADAEVASARDAEDKAKAALDAEEKKVTDARDELDRLRGEETATAESLNHLQMDSEQVESELQAYEDAIEVYFPARDVLFGEDGRSGAEAAYFAATDAIGAAQAGSTVSNLIDGIKNIVDCITIAHDWVYDANNGTKMPNSLSISQEVMYANRDKAIYERSKQSFLDDIDHTNAEIDKVSERIESMVEEQKELNEDLTRLAGEAESSQKSLEQKQKSLEDALSAETSAREAYEEAEEALGKATPANVAELTAKANEALDALEAAMSARQSAHDEMAKASDRVNEIEKETGKKSSRLETLAQQMDEEGEHLQSLKGRLQELSDFLSGSQEHYGVERMLADAEGRINAWTQTLANAKAEFATTSSQLLASVSGDAEKTSLVSQFIDAAQAFIDAVVSFNDAWGDLNFTEGCLVQYAWLHEDYVGNVENTLWGFIFENDKTFEENLIESTTLYLEKLATWNGQIAQTGAAGKAKKALEESVEQLRSEFEATQHERGGAQNSANKAHDALEIAQLRDKVAGIADEVLGQALEEAEDRRDAAKAAYDRAKAVTADKVRAGTVGDEDYTYLNEYKSAYESAKAAYDEAKAAYDEASAAYDQSYAAYRAELQAANPAPVQEETRQTPQNETLGSYSSSSDDSSSDSEPETSATEKAAPTGKVENAATRQATAPKPAETVAAQKSLTKAVESAAAQVKVEGVTGGEVKIVADPVMNEVAEGVYEVESMPEIDLEALVANDPNHTVDDIKEVWWCVYVDGVKVRIMSALGALAPGAARVVWAEDAALASAALEGIDLGDGDVFVLTPDMELSLDVVWA